MKFKYVIIYKDNLLTFVILCVISWNTEAIFLNTTQLETFLSVANFLNFSRAAEQLQITQPAVSHQINTLEDELGAKLFYRTSKSVRLTEAGQLFTQYASEILKLSGVSKARVRECRESFPLRLGIGCRNFLELRLLKPALARLRQEAPDLLPVLRLIPSASLENLLEEDDIQLLLTFQDSTPQKAVFRELVRCPLVFVCDRSHPFAAREALTLAQLQSAGRIATCPPPSYPPSLFAIQSRVLSGRSPDQLLFCDSLDIAYTLIASGYACAVMPDLKPARMPNLRYIPMPEFDPLSFGVLYRSASIHQPARLFLSLLETLLRETTTSSPSFSTM